MALVVVYVRMAVSVVVMCVWLMVLLIAVVLVMMCVLRLAVSEHDTQSVPELLQSDPKHEQARDQTQYRKEALWDNVLRPEQGHQPQGKYASSMCDGHCRAEKSGVAGCAP